MISIYRLIIGLGTLWAVLGIAISGCGADEAKSVPAASTTRPEDDEHGHSHEGEGLDTHDEHAEHPHQVGEAPAEITISSAAIADAGIVVEPVTKGRLTTSLTVPGRVVPTQQGLAHVGTVVAGRVSRLLVREGSRVSRGQPLAEIEVYDIGVVKGELLRASADVELRRSALERQERLGKEGIGAQRAIEEARAAYQQAMAEQRSAEARLRAAGINPQSVRAGNFSSRILLRAPIAGVVARRHVALGDYLEPSKDAFEIMNTSVAWIDAQASSTDATSIGVGDPGFVSNNDTRQAGRVIFVSPAVDPESRTVTVRVEVDNTKLGLRHEAYVNVEFEKSADAMGIVIPKEAIESEAGEHFVYIEHKSNTFQRLPVELGREMGDRIVVTAGLEENARIVVKGVFYVRSERQKGELAERDHHH